MNELTEKEQSNYDADWAFVFDVLSSARKEKKQSKTYILKDTSSKLYKIGRTSNVEGRIKSLSVANPNLKIILVIDSNVENHLHKQFKEKKVSSEWYSLTSSDIEYVKKQYCRLSNDNQKPNEI